MKLLSTINWCFRAILTIMLFTLLGCTQANINTEKTVIPSMQVSIGTTDSIKNTINLPTAVPETEIPISPKPEHNSPTETKNPEDSIYEEICCAQRYAIDAVYDYVARTLTASEMITFTNPIHNPLSEIKLLVEPQRWPGVFKLNAIIRGNGTPISDYQANRNVLTIPLDEELLSGETISFRILYQLQLPELHPGDETRGPSPFGFTDRQANLTDWYPYIAHLTEDGKWITHNPWYFGEHAVYPTSEIDIQLEVLNADENILIAASELPVISEGVYHYYQNSSRSFAIALLKDYVMHSSNVDEKSIQIYTKKEYTEHGEWLSLIVGEAVSFFSSTFGPIQRNSISLINADFNHGMEYSGLVYLSDAFYKLYDGGTGNYLTAITVHEIAHQWWFDAIGNDQAMEPWLDEALCTFSEQLYYENLDGDMDWWQYTRIDVYEPDGFINTPIYYNQGYRAYINAVYLRGALFFNAVRDLLGEELFQNILRDYYMSNAYNEIVSDELLQFFSEATSTDLSPIYEEFFSSEW